MILGLSWETNIIVPCYEYTYSLGIIMIHKNTFHNYHIIFLVDDVNLVLLNCRL